MLRLYDPRRPRSGLLDRRAELLVPTLDQLRELLRKKNDPSQPDFYAVEDTTGVIHGFCSLRSMHPEVRYAHALVMLLDDADYATPLARESGDFLAERAFKRLKLNKIVGQCLDSEVACRAFWLCQGFESDGVMRDVLYANGRWYSQESLTLFATRRQKLTASAEPGCC